MTALLLFAMLGLAAPRPCAAQEVDELTRLVNEVAAKGLPVESLKNKIREGLAKGYDSKRIEPVVRQMSTHLDTADRLMREMEPAAGGAGREASVMLLADAIGSGVTPDEVREIRRRAQLSPVTGKPPASAESLAAAAKGLSSIKEARLPVADGTAVIAEAVRRGFRSYEIVDLGREVRRREADYRGGRASLNALREAIARGDRPDQLFRDIRAETAVERPAAARPETPVERPSRPETPQRPERPARPETPERPATTRDR